MEEEVKVSQPAEAEKEINGEVNEKKVPVQEEVDVSGMQYLPMYGIQVPFSVVIQHLGRISGTIDMEEDKLMDIKSDLIPGYLTRLLTEADDLTDKTTKLCLFLMSGKCPKQPALEMRQCLQMLSYLDVLIHRLVIQTRIVNSRFQGHKNKKTS